MIGTLRVQQFPAIPDKLCLRQHIGWSTLVAFIGNSMNPDQTALKDQTAHREQSDQGSYCFFSMILCSGER